MHTRYVFFYTAKAAIFQIYAFLLLLLTLFFIAVTSTINQFTVTVGTFLYIITVVPWAFYIDRKSRGKAGYLGLQESQPTSVKDCPAVAQTETAGR